MTTTKIIEEQALSLAEARTVIDAVEKRDDELNDFSNRAKEYLGAFVTLDEKKRAELEKKLVGLDLTRLKHEHITKIIDFLPKTVDDLKVVLQAYPLSMPKKDQDSIVAVVKEF